MFNENIFVQLHIPRTAGTSFQNHIGDSYTKDNDSWLHHYHWTEGMSPFLYSLNDIPLLKNRTREQQNQLKVLSGHSTFINSHRWLKVCRDPLYITFVRDPLKRILSSFNHRHSRHILTQDPANFTASPLMNTNAVANFKTAADYDSLWQYYKDAYVEHNLQTKWIIKSFLRFAPELNGWQPHPTYDGDLHFAMTSPSFNVPVTMPEWFWWHNYNDFDYWNIVCPLLDKFWWIGYNDNLTQDFKDFCKFTDIEFIDNVNENKTGDKVPPYWTIEDIMSQPDVHKIIESEKYDYLLYNFVKQNFNTRPF